MKKKTWLLNHSITMHRTQLRCMIILSAMLLLVSTAHSQAAGKRNLSFKGRGKHNGIIRMAQFEGQKGTFYYAYTDATRKGSIIFIDRCGQSHVLSESSPDAGNETGLTVNTRVKVMNYAEAEAFANSMNKIHELGKRNAAVNIIRDQLYKLNELINNVSYFNCDLDENGNILPGRFVADTLFDPATGGITSISNHRTVGGIWAGSLLNKDSITMLYKTAFNNIKDIAIEESKAEAIILDKKIELTKAETEKLKEKFRQDSIVNVLMVKITALGDTIKSLDVKIKEAEKKATDASKGQKDSDDAKKLAIAEKELAIKSKEELLDLIKKWQGKACCD